LRVYEIGAFREIIEGGNYETAQSGIFVEKLGEVVLRQILRSAGNALENGPYW
jgi:hypothetical protein